MNRNISMMLTIMANFLMYNNKLEPELNEYLLYLTGTQNNSNFKSFLLHTVEFYSIVLKGIYLFI